MAADAQRGGFAQDHFAKPIRIRLGAQHGEQHSGAVLFHLDRRVEHVERARLQRGLDEMAKVLGVDVVEVRLDDGDGVALPVERLGLGRCLRLAKHGAEDIGPGVHVARAQAVADPLRCHAAHQLERLGELGQQRRAGGGDEFVRLVALVHDDAARAENFQRGGGRHRETAVRAIDPAGALGDWRGEHARFAEQLERDAAADDVDDRVHRADLVKMHLVRRHAVNLALGHGDSAENGNRFFLHPVAERTGADERLDVGEVAFVRVAVVVVTVRM